MAFIDPSCWLPARRAGVDRNDGVLAAATALAVVSRKARCRKFRRLV